MWQIETSPWKTTQNYNTSEAHPKNNDTSVKHDNIRLKKHRSKLQCRSAKSKRKRENSGNFSAAGRPYRKLRITNSDRVDKKYVRYRRGTRRMHFGLEQFVLIFFVKYGDKTVIFAGHPSSPSADSRGNEADGRKSDFHIRNWPWSRLGCLWIERV